MTHLSKETKTMDGNSLDITQERLTPANFGVYDSKRVSSLRNFAVNNNIQILVINIDSFAKDENIINKPNDKLTGKKPLEFIQATCPIVIVDEPQNMETELRKKAIENLNPLCTLRYSATHIKRYNMVYSLDPVKAYDLGLVKQIEVDSIVTENDFNEAFVEVCLLSLCSLCFSKKKIIKTLGNNICELCVCGANSMLLHQLAVNNFR